MEPICEFIHVSKSLGKHTVLSDIHIQFPKGNVIGIVGTNGCGKTTMLRMITGMYLPDSGQVVTMGKSSAALEHAELGTIGVVHQENRLLSWMRVHAHLKYTASFYQQWDLELQNRLIKEFDLDLHAKVGALSVGNRQKLSIILAVCHHPKFLIMDEPASALDPGTRHQFLHLVMELLATVDMTVIIASHDLSDIEKIISRVACLHKGQIVASGDWDDLQERYTAWQVTSQEGLLPASYPQSYVLKAEGNQYQALVYTLDANSIQEDFSKEYKAQVRQQPMNLEKMFHLWVNS